MKLSERMVDTKVQGHFLTETYSIVSLWIIEVTKLEEELEAARERLVVADIELTRSYTPKKPLRVILSVGDRVEIEVAKLPKDLAHIQISAVG